MGTQTDEIKEYVKQYIKDNLTVVVDAYEGGSSWGEYTNIKVDIFLELEGEKISYSGSSFNIGKS
jgi:hypothetical protein